MARRVVIYDDWSKGEAGLKMPDGAPKGSWSGTNLYMTRKGELAVRLGLEALTLGDPATTQTGTPLDHTGLSLGYSDKVFIIQEDNIRTTPLNGVWSTAVAALGQQPSEITAASCLGGADKFFFTDRQDSDVYSIDTSATVPVLTDLTGPGGMAIAVYGDRLVVGSLDQTTNQNVVEYSEAAAFSTWVGVANQFRVGYDDSAITGLYTMRNNLYIAKPEGWFVVTGTLGSNESLRQVNNMPTPSRQLAGHVSTNDKLYYVATGSPHPFVFDGTYVKRLDHILVGRALNDVGVYVMRGEDDSVVLWNHQSNDDLDPDLWLLHSGMWTRHVLANPWDSTRDALIKGVVGQSAEALTPTPTYPLGFQIYVVVRTTTVTDPEVYGFSLYNDSLDPTRTGIIGMPGENSNTSKITATLSLPEWWSDGGSEIHVRQVMIDFRAFDQGTTGDLDNQIICTVDTLRNYDGPSRTSASLTWAESEADHATGEGTRMRQVFSFGDQGVGNGFQIHLTGVKGVIIRRIQVVIESQSVRS